MSPLPFRACALIPAYDAEATCGHVVEDLRHHIPELECIFVVDDGSRDQTATVARGAGATVLRHPRNRGKGAALVTGLRAAHDAGYEVALTVDADGQHPGASARAVMLASTEPAPLVLGVRNLARDGAPRANRFSNGISNFFLSRFAGRPLADTQCGLRRYPIARTLSLGARSAGYAFEAEILLRAIAGGVPILEHPVPVHYPPEEQRVTHFHRVKDPARIIVTVLRTVHELRSRDVQR